MKIVEKEIDARERAAASLCMGGKRQSQEQPTVAALLTPSTEGCC